MMRVLAGCVLTALAAFGQPAANRPEFEVATVKPTPPPEPGKMMRFSTVNSGGPGTPDPERVHWSGVTMKNLLMRAYNMKPYQISGPSWMDTERFDIDAKVPKGATKEDFMLMIQNLLADRFKVEIHRETKEMQMYALIVGKNGHKMKVSEAVPEAKDASKDGPGGGPNGAAPPPPPPPIGRLQIGKDGFPEMPKDFKARPGSTSMMMMPGRARMTANGVGMEQLVGMLSGQLAKPVTDMTGLKEKFDFTLTFEPNMNAGPMGPMGPAMSGMMAVQRGGPDGGDGGDHAKMMENMEPAPTIFNAVKEQLGLALDPRKGPVEIIVVDKAEKTPSEN